jgi:hypothetical protein
MSTKPKSPHARPQINDWIGGGRAVLRGIPIGGELMDEGFAAFDATFRGDRSKSWGDRWNSALDEQRAYDQAFDEKHPVASVALRTAGNFAVPGGAVLGAASKLSRAAPVLRMVGGKLLSRLPKSRLARDAIKSTAEEAAIGAADGFLAGQGGSGERLHHAGSEFIRGGTWGAGKPFLSKGLGKEVADGSLRRGPRAERHADWVLDRLDAGSPVMGVIPLPWQAY